MKSIGSTMSGSGSCRVDYILRKAQRAADINTLRHLVGDVRKEARNAAEENSVIVESSQGTLLSLAWGEYPNVTSKNITTGSALEDIGLPWRLVSEVIMIVKAVPSREGAGSFGSTEEYSTQEIMYKGLIETSSIGGQVRRKGKEIDWELLTLATELNGPTQIALTFAEHFDPRVKNATKLSELTDEVHLLTEKIRSITGVPVTMVNTGKPFNCVIDLSGRYANLGQVSGEIDFASFK